jgi:hypothetical protein
MRSGCSLCAAQMRCTDVSEMPAARAIARPVQCVALWSASQNGGNWAEECGQADDRFPSRRRVASELACEVRNSGIKPRQVIYGCHVGVWTENCDGRRAVLPLEVRNSRRKFLNLAAINESFPRLDLSSAGIPRALAVFEPPNLAATCTVEILALAGSYSISVQGGPGAIVVGGKEAPTR